MKDRFKNAHMNRQLKRQGSEPADGGWPHELQPPRRQKPTKAELRQTLVDAMANTAKIKSKRIPSKRGRP
jgi:hypothetical protein